MMEDHDDPTGEDFDHTRKNKLMEKKIQYWNSCKFNPVEVKKEEEEYEIETGVPWYSNTSVSGTVTEDETSTDHSNSVNDEKQMRFPVILKNSALDRDEYGDDDEAEAIGAGGSCDSAGRYNPYSWNSEVEQLFIDKVKSYPPLYDHSNKNWKNTAIKDVIWKEISAEIGIPVVECRRHLKHMRDKFVRHRRTGRGSKRWKVGASMNFLVELDLIKHRPTTKPFIFTNNMKNPVKSTSIRSKANDTTSNLTGQTIIEPIGAVDSTSNGNPHRLSRRSSDSFESSTSSPLTLMYKTIHDSFTSTHNSATSSNPTRKSSTIKSIFQNGNNSNSRIPRKSSITSTHSTSNAKILGNGNMKAEPVPVSKNGIASASNNLISKGNSQGPNYFFGQYISSVLDSLPQSDSLLLRHKLQEILFETQQKFSKMKSKSNVLKFQCVNCSTTNHVLNNFPTD